MSSLIGADVFIDSKPFQHHHFDHVTSVPPATAAIFECPVCQRQFATKKYLSMHAALHKTTTSTPPGNVAIDDDVMNQSMYYQHFSSQVMTSRGGGGQDNGTPHQHHQHHHHPQQQQQQQLSWPCPICGKTFAQNSNFRNHVRTHSDERPYVCLVCFIGFKERYHLKKHALFKHSGELKEQCRQCGKRFKDLTAVRAHERTHSDLRPYRCDRCEKTFKTSECLWHHENRSKTCGRPPGEVVATGGRRRSKHTAHDVDAATNKKTTSSLSDNGQFESISSSASTTPVKTEAPIGQLDSINEFDLDLDLDADFGQFNGFQWSSGSGADLLDESQPFNYRKSSTLVDDLVLFPTPVADQSATPSKCEAVDFRLMHGDDAMMSRPPNRPLVANGRYGVESEMKTYDVIESNADRQPVVTRDVIINDCRFDPRQTKAHAHSHTVGRSPPQVCSSACCVPETHHVPSPSTLSSCSWYSSVPTAIVAPMQRTGNMFSMMESQHSNHQQQRQQLPSDQQQRQQHPYQTFTSCDDATYSLPPFETFMPPRKSTARTNSGRPQHQQYPAVARCLMQTSAPPQTCAHTRSPSNGVVHVYGSAPAYQRAPRTVCYHVV